MALFRRLTYLALASSVFLGCGVETIPKDGSFMIGAAMDVTGNQPTETWLRALELCEEHVNKGLDRSDSWHAWEMELRIEDTQLKGPNGVMHSLALRDAGAKALITQQAPVTMAINKLNYDDDDSNDLGMGLICGNCVPPQFNDINFNAPPDPVAQAAARDLENFMARTVQSNIYDAPIYKDLMREKGGDVNGDGLLKVVVYTTNRGSLNSYRAAVKEATEELASELGVSASVETTVRHEFGLDPNTYDFVADFDLLLDNQNEDIMEGSKVDGLPDFLIDLAASGVHAASIAEYERRGSEVAYIHAVNFRNENVLPTIGALSEGHEGVSPVILAVDGAGNLTESARTFADALGTEGFPPEVETASFYDACMVWGLAVIHASNATATTPMDVAPLAVRDSLYMINDPSGELVGSGTSEFAKAIDLINQGRAINYDGASGPVDFDMTGEVRQVVSHFKAELFQFRDLRLFDCISSDQCPEMSFQ